MNNEGDKQGSKEASRIRKRKSRARQKKQKEEQQQLGALQEQAERSTAIIYNGGSVSLW